MTLTDSGPLVALGDSNDIYHGRCLQAFSVLPKPFLTTLPAVTEVMHFLGRRIGWVAQERLWRLIRQRELQIADLDESMIERMGVLMEKYSDSPMDFADASLVAVAERRDFVRIFTLDRHFRDYRLKTGRPLQVVPAET